MKNSFARAILIITVMATGCGDDSSTNPSTMMDYRQDMRDFVQGISAYAKGINPNFIVIPQNGQELLTLNGSEDGTPAWSYIEAIEGVGREDLYYGYGEDNQPTPTSEVGYMIAFLDIAESNGVEALVTDYCWARSYVDDSYARNNAKGYISFAADHRELDDIPAYPETPYNANTSHITSLAEAKNFLYLINSSSFSGKEALLEAIQGTSYDLVIMDLFFNDTEEFTSTDISALKVKVSGGSRLIFAYMSIGEAEDYRYYWQPEWDTIPPPWLAEENPYWPGNFKVRYWYEEWQNIIFGNNDSYLKKILDVGFDGVYLDIIDAFEYFEGP